jgi:hypothetical protein
MSMKKTDLAKNLASKLGGQIKNGQVPDRFSQGANAASAKREQRRLDAKAGLVPFACKLPADLVAKLRAQQGDGINQLVAQLLSLGLTQHPGVEKAGSSLP